MSSFVVSDIKSLDEQMKHHLSGDELRKYVELTEGLVKNHEDEGTIY